jgi:EpsI family protein
MARLQKAGIILVILFGASIFASRAMQPSARPWHDMLGRVPINIGEWHGENDEFSEDVKEILAGAKLMLRYYSNPAGEIVALNVVNSRSINSFHDPHFCFRGAGFEPAAEYDVMVPFGENDSKQMKAHLMIMRNKEGREQYLLSWYSDGKGTWASVGDFKLHLLWERFFHRRFPPGFLISLTTPVDVDNPEIPKDRLMRFARELIPYVHPGF